MNPRFRRTCLFLVLPVLITLGSVRPARACAPAPPPQVRVDIAQESAIILWDEAGKTEHFIRRASFKTAAGDFGFLVPTPSQPTLAEASDEAFAELEKLTAPRVETRSRPAGYGCIGCAGGAPAPEGAAGAVRVLDEKRVAGHDAVVLEANDPAALNQWLQDHGYATRPALTAWLKPDVDAGWKISAFKIAKKAPDTPEVATTAVRMTFHTDKPFFPYREPEDQRSAKPEDHPNRLLRVYFLDQSRVKGTLGAKADTWPGKAVWANQVPDSQRAHLLELLKLPAATPPAAWWLTEFEDRSSPRPGTEDVYFARSEDQSPVERPPVIHYVVEKSSLYLMVGCFLAYFLTVYASRYLRSKQAGPGGRSGA
jgi:hypothetical protein